MQVRIKDGKVTVSGEERFSERKGNQQSDKDAINHRNGRGKIIFEKSINLPKFVIDNNLEEEVYTRMHVDTLNGSNTLEVIYPEENGKNLKNLKIQDKADDNTIFQENLEATFSCGKISPKIRKQSSSCFRSILKSTSTVQSISSESLHLLIKISDEVDSGSDEEDTKTTVAGAETSSTSVPDLTKNIKSSSYSSIDSLYIPRGDNMSNMSTISSISNSISLRSRKTMTNLSLKNKNLGNEILSFGDDLEEENGNGEANEDMDGFFLRGKSFKTVQDKIQFYTAVVREGITRDPEVVRIDFSM